MTQGLRAKPLAPGYLLPRLRRWLSFLGLILTSLLKKPFSVRRERNVECAGRAEQRGRFGFFCRSKACPSKAESGYAGLRTPKRSRATLASALQRVFRDLLRDTDAVYEIGEARVGEQGVESWIRLEANYIELP